MDGVFEVDNEFIGGEVMNITKMRISELKEYQNNPRLINDEAIDRVAASIKEFGFKVPIIVDEDNVIVAGHTRKLAARSLGMEEVPVIIADDLTEDQIKAFRLADNRVAEFSEWNFDKLETELEGLADGEFNLDILDFDLDDYDNEDYNDVYDEFEKGSLNRDFLISPFSYLDTRNGEWKNRRDEWKKLGIKSELGREDNLTFGSNLTTDTLGGTSIFDPVLCELMYKWYIPNKGDKIIDCFAGGSVRGVVAEQSGYKYHGVDLRKEQVESNYVNAEEIGCNMDNIKWYTGDSNKIDEVVEEKEFDFMFTCPPYHDLEVYSDNENDISNMEYDQFVDIYENILIKTANKVKDNRFAAVVISDIRDKKGFYRDLTGVTKRAMGQAGFNLYNDLILINAVGTGALRARRNMKSRKNVRLHQNVLVFFKGDTKNIKQDFNVIEFDDEELIEEAKEEV